MPEYPTGPREPRKKKQGVSKGIQYKKKMPHIKGKNAFLRYVQDHDCIKDKITGCYRVEPVDRERDLKPKPRNTKNKNKKKEENKKSDKRKPELTKLEKK